MRPAESLVNGALRRCRKRDCNSRQGRTPSAGRSHAFRRRYNDHVGPSNPRTATPIRAIGCLNAPHSRHKKRRSGLRNTRGRGRIVMKNLARLVPCVSGRQGSHHDPTGGLSQGLASPGRRPRRNGRMPLVRGPRKDLGPAGMGAGPHSDARDSALSLCLAMTIGNRGAWECDTHPPRIGVLTAWIRRRRSRGSPRPEESP